MSVSGVSVAAAFAGGFASFASPCVLPLAPVYLSVVGALDLTRRVDAGDTAPEGSYPEASQDPPGSAGTATALRSRRSRGVGAITRDTLFFVVGDGGHGRVFGNRPTCVGYDVSNSEPVTPNTGSWQACSSGGPGASARTQGRRLAN